jgi:MFS family permease
MDVRAGTMRAASGHRPFRRLLAALAVSQAGDWLYNVALLALVYERTHAAAWVTIATVARVLPMVACGPFAGVLADRYDRRRLMILSDLVRAAAMVVLFATAALGWPIVLAPVMAALATAAGSPYPSAVAVTVPRLVPEAALGSANGLRSTVGSACVVIGPALGGLLLVVGSPATAFAANAASFVASALLVAAIPDGGWRLPPGGADRSVVHPVTEARAGLAALRANPLALRLAGADVTCSVVYGAQTVLLLLVSRSLGHGAAGYGWLLAGAGLGGVGGALLGARASRRRRGFAPAGVALALVGVALGAVAVAGSLAVVMVLAVVGGMAAIAVEVMTDTTLQQTLDEDVLGRAYGFTFPAAIGGIALGAAVATPLVGLLGLHGALVALGGLAVLQAAVVAARRPVGRRAGSLQVGASVP